MKRPVYFLSFIFFVYLLSSCTSSTKWNEVVTDDKYKMQIPAYMTSKNMNEDAGLSYMNPLKEMYVMVIEDTFEKVEKVITENGLEEDFPLNFEGFIKLISNSDEEKFLIKEDRSHLKDTMINSLPAKVFENSRTINNVNVFYKVALVKGKETYYQVISWTLDNRKDKNRETIEKMINSFEEL